MGTIGEGLWGDKKKTLIETGSWLGNHLLVKKGATIVYLPVRTKASLCSMLVLSVWWALLVAATCSAHGEGKE
jgi:hypothetical protein